MKKAKNLMSKTGKMLLVLGFVFSQMSFPLSVLADEISEADNVKNVETEFHEEQTEEDTTTKEETTEESTKTTEEQDDTIKEPSTDIPEEDSKEDTSIEDTTETVEFTYELLESADKNLYIIKNKLDVTLTVSQLKEVDSTITTIVDTEGIEITDENAVLKTNDEVTIILDDQTTKTYTILILGDIDNDNMVTENDEQELLSLLKQDLEKEYLEENMLMLDLNKDEVFNILDVTHSIFNKGIWENDTVATDDLENYAMAEEETYIGQEIEVTYYIEGFNTDNLTGIEGMLYYDEEVLELTNINVNGDNQELLEESNKLVYLLDNYNEDGCLITLTFKALASGTSIVTIDNIVASVNGVAAKLSSNKVSTSFNIYGTGGDVNPDEEENNNSEDNNTTEENTTTETTPSTPTPTQTVVEVQSTNQSTSQTTSTQYVALSSDNYIKSLIIEGYEIDFDKNTTTYSIKVKSNVTSLGLSIALNSSTATYQIEGNEKFVTGENIVEIIVTAQDGSTKTYTIKVEKEKKIVEEDVDTEESVEKNTSKTIIIILIVLVIIGLIYVIFKDDEEDNKESKKDTNTKQKETNNKKRK